MGKRRGQEIGVKGGLGKRHPDSKPVTSRQGFRGYEAYYFRGGKRMGEKIRGVKILDPLEKAAIGT